VNPIQVWLHGYKVTTDFLHALWLIAYDGAWWVLRDLRWRY
jgi:hypothetical protein